MLWIVVDGIDGSGKSTVAGWVRAHYQDRGCKVTVVTHPSPGRAGRLSRRFLEKRGMAARLSATVFFIIDVLASLRRMSSLQKESDVVVFVRYLMATAYLPEKLAPAGYEFFAKLLPAPQYLLLVDTRPEVALARIEGRQEAREMFEDLDSLERTRGKVLRLAKANGWQILDNSGPEEEGRASLTTIMAAWDRH